MQFFEYQQRTEDTAVYPNIGSNIVYPSLGLASEAGEVADIVKRVVRDKHGVLDEADRNNLKKEIGDVLWYAARLAYEIGADLNEIAEENLKKLAKRKVQGTLVHHE